MPSSKKKRSRATAPLSNNVTHLVAQLTSENDRRAANAAVSLGSLAMRSPALLSAVLDANAVSLLIKCVGDGKEAVPDASLKGLVNLAVCVTAPPGRVWREVCDAGGIAVLANVLASGTELEKTSAVALLINLLKGDADGTRGAVPTLLDAGILAPVVQLILRGTNINQKDFAVRVLWLLLETDPTRAEPAILDVGEALPLALRSLVNQPNVPRELKQTSMKLARHLTESREASTDDDEGGEDCSCTRVHTNVFCSGVKAPAVYADYELPLQQEDGCRPECPFARTFTYPDCLDIGDADAVTGWFKALACAHGCDPQVVLDALEAPDDASKLPDGFVVRKNERSDIHEVYAFLVVGESNKVYVFDVTMLPVGTKRVYQLPRVTGEARRAAFAKLSEAIEAAAPHLPEGLFKQLYDAAMDVHRA